MASVTDANITLDDALKSITLVVSFRLPRRSVVRLWIATRPIRLAARIIGCNIEVE